MTPEQLYVETVTERSGGFVTASEVRPATKRDIEKAKSLHRYGKCDHSVVRDGHGWMYDARSCATCGKGLGTV